MTPNQEVEPFRLSLRPIIARRKPAEDHSQRAHKERDPMKFRKIHFSQLQPTCNLNLKIPWGRYRHGCDPQRSRDPRFSRSRAPFSVNPPVIFRSLENGKTYLQFLLTIFFYPQPYTLASFLFDKPLKRLLFSYGFFDDFHLINFMR